MSTNETHDQKSSPPGRLRKVETEVLIPRHLEYKINHELCRAESKDFHDCAEAEGLMVVVRCRALLKIFEDCSNRWFRDQELRKQVTAEYLEQRDRYQQTGEAKRSPFARMRSSSGTS